MVKQLFCFVKFKKKIIIIIKICIRQHEKYNDDVIVNFWFISPSLLQGFVIVKFVVYILLLTNETTNNLKTTTTTLVDLNTDSGTDYHLHSFPNAETALRPFKINEILRLKISFYVQQ